MLRNFQSSHKNWSLHITIYKIGSLKFARNIKVIFNLLTVAASSHILTLFSSYSYSIAAMIYIIGLYRMRFIVIINRATTFYWLVIINGNDFPFILWLALTVHGFSRLEVLYLWKWNMIFRWLLNYLPLHY